MYYLHDDENQSGPFTTEELQNLSIKPTTMIWHDGLDTWVEAKNVEGLKEFVRTMPPPFVSQKHNKIQDKIVQQPLFATIQESRPVHSAIQNQNSSYQSTYHPDVEKLSRKRKGGVTLLIMLVLIGCGVGFMSQKKADEAKYAFRSNPSNYIYAAHNGFKYNPILGGITNLTLTVRNNSDFSIDNSFLTVSYIRKNGNIYKSEEVSSGYIPAHGMVTMNAPDSDAGMDVSVEVKGVNSTEANEIGVVGKLLNL